MQTIRFFDLPLISTTPAELPGLLDQWMEQGSWLVTINAEMLYRTTHDEAYRQLLQHAQVLLPDGFGVVLWSRGLIKYRFPGVELAAQVLDRALAQGLKVVCIVRKHGLSTGLEVQTAIVRRWPEINVRVVECEPQDEVEKVLPELREAQVILVNFGAPEQDQWLAKLKQGLPQMKIGIGVGGTFDYWVGQVKRAPVFFRKLGLEWFWRLITQPWRTLRIWNAVIKFSWAAWRNPPSVASVDQA